MAAIAAIVSALAAPAAADASTCGSRTVKNHSSSWNTHASNFYSQGCLVQGSTYVYATGSFDANGTAGVEPLRVNVTLKDLTSGATLVARPAWSWGESSSIINRHFTVSTPALSRVAGHKYAVWAWTEPNISNDGKGVFYDPQSYAEWKA